MWDFSNGRFSKPHVPLFSWEELGKIDPSLLRTMRHIGFSKYKPRCDGTWYINEKTDNFDMGLAQLSSPSDVPDSIEPEELPIKDELLKPSSNHEDCTLIKLNLNRATLTDIMTLHAMEEDLAIEISEYAKDNTITDGSDLLDIESIDKQMLKCWNDDLADMRFDINSANRNDLKKIKGISDKLTTIILETKSKLGEFSSIKELNHISGIGKSKYAEIKARFKSEISI